MKDNCAFCQCELGVRGNGPLSRKCQVCRKSAYPDGLLAEKKKTNEFSGSNNLYFKDGCPALMGDGRFITYYNSSNELTEDLRRMNGFNNPNEFRRYMQLNGDKFMNDERNYMKINNTCAPSTTCSEGWCYLWNNGNGSWNNS